jgi:FkbM family methyltransferase
MATLTLARRVLRRLTTHPFSEAALIQQHFGRRRGGMMFDVGAHFGESHRPYLERGWHVMAFEPDPSNRSRIRTTPGAGTLDLLDCAVGERPLADAAFYASDESTGVSTLVPFIASHKPVCRVQVRTLDEVCQERAMTRCDFLKIDTEGHDLFVLRGFPWDRMQPEVILCEFEDRKTQPLGYDDRALGEFLTVRGYAVFLSEWDPIERYGGQHTWRRAVRFPVSLLDARGWGNFIAFRQDVDVPRALAKAV